MARIIYPEESYAIVGACFDVYKEMGCRFLEPVYQECTEMELTYRIIPFQSQCEFTMKYRDRELRQRFRLDLVCYEKIILELKAVSNLVDEHRAQLINYLNATKLELGILVNFGHYPKLEYERFILTNGKVKRESTK